ncbi:putative IQ motif, EF-hand binding protein [Rosa chinensis]|uniref:Putative IQ motif, EF-hand binding protein n=1 Tax=Rosa chinensis TaxID=74649 RepID=A0A2P6SMB7_ROSCH|nr:BAG family molecular chaperone regulator 7 [Rosa chinensis]PRQ59827.1 putative IQ motif, EF-hand binding protein [Rosa chinensis]
MSWLRRIDLIEPYYYCPPPPAVLVRETSIFAAAPKLPSFFEEVMEEDFELGYALDLLCPSPVKTPSLLSYKLIQRVERLGGELYLQSLSDRVTELESRFDRLAKIKAAAAAAGLGDRKYTYTAEIKAPEKKYMWTTEIKEGKHKKSERKYKWTAEVEGKGEISRKYTFTASSGDAEDHSEKKEKKKKHHKVKKEEGGSRVVEIEELAADHGAVVLRQAFAKRTGGSKVAKGKNKELSPQDAAMMIQGNFRAYLIRRSQALRALRDLAVAKSKLKELRALFNNFSYRRRVAHDTAERQRFTEKIIVLLLTVDAIEGADLMVRSAKRSMVDELEAMLEVVDPQPAGKSLSMRRRTFDMPDGVIQREIAEGVAQVVQMLDREENSSTFEACL